jgi:predicted Ser/Thr protein kinase
MNNQSRAVLASADPRVQAALKDYLDCLSNGKPMGPDQLRDLPEQVVVELRAILANNPDIHKMVRPDQDVVKHTSEGIDQKPDRSKTTTHSMSGQSEGTLHEEHNSKVPKIDPSLASRSREDLPEVFGRYRVQKKLGSGAMGAVYLAEDTLLQRKVALKTPTFDDDNDGELLKRFYREARAVANLKHPALCAVYDVGQIDGRHYISMEFIPGKKLQEFIKPDSPMSEKQAMAVVRKIASGMHEAHMHGVIHRDLKPDNIMINEKGEPVVMDFGLVHKIESRDSAKLTQHGSLIGSPAYMSKEQVEGDTEKLTAATDQYSLGVVLYQLRGTTGTQHFVDKQHWFCTLKYVIVPALRGIEVTHGKTGSGGSACVG